MLKGSSTRRVTDMRHYNDQNPNLNPATARGRVPQLVRGDGYHGEVRTIIISAAKMRPAQAAGRTINGVQVPARQAVGVKRKYE